MLVLLLCLAYYCGCTCMQGWPPFLVGCKDLTFVVTVDFLEGGGGRREASHKLTVWSGVIRAGAGPLGGGDFYTLM